MYNTHHGFEGQFHPKKSAHYTRVNTVIRNLVFPFLTKGIQSVGKKVIKKVQKRVRTAAKRKATQLVESVSKRAKRGVGDIFGH